MWLEIADHVAHLDDLDRVETAGRLVENEELGLVHDRLPDANALSIAVREIRDRLVADVGQVGELDDLWDAALHFGGAHAAQATCEGQVVADQHVLIDGRVLGYESDPLAHFVRFLDRVEVTDLDRS